MTKDSIRQMILGEFSGAYNKSGSEFSKILTNEKYTGAIEKILKKASDYGDEYTSNPSIYNQSGAMLDKSVKFFTYLEQFTNETESSLKNRIKSIFIRGGNSSWGTPENIKEVFQAYFDIESVYVMENTNDSEDELIGNLLQNPEFTDVSDWTFSDAERNVAARFSKTYGALYLADNGFISQNITLSSNKVYFLHFFGKGDIKVYINNQLIQSFSKINWGVCSCWFNSGDDTEFSIKIVGSKDTSVDYFRLFPKQNYPTFTVIAQFEGSSAKNALALAPGKDDPIEDKNENLYGYYNNAYLTGVATGFAKDVYQDLLDVLRAQGIKAYIDIVNKDYIA